MPTDRDTHDDDPDKPSLRQKLHAATGDREGEAEALADRAGDEITEEEAEVAVRRAHGDITGGEPKQSDLASPEDAEEVREEESS